MKIVSTEDLSDRAVITCIKTDNKNKKRSKFQAEQTDGLKQRGIKRTIIKQAQNEFNR